MTVSGGAGFKPRLSTYRAHTSNQALKSSQLITDISEGQRCCISNRLEGTYYGLVCMVHLPRIASHAVREESSVLIVQINAGSMVKHLFKQHLLMLFNCALCVIFCLSDKSLALM